MPSDNRMRKIGEEILRELSRLVSALKDPRVGGLVSLTHVDVTNDLAYARVFVSVLDSTADAGVVMEGLESASGYLRRELAHAMSLRHTPLLRFVADDSMIRGARILDLLSREEREG